MAEPIKLHYHVSNDDFTKAGEASSDLKRKLKQMGFPSSAIRRSTIALYEGEINLVIHAYGGDVDVTLDDDRIHIVLTDKGPGIKDVDLCMQEGYSTAPAEVRSLGFGAGMGIPNMKRYSDEFSIVSEYGVGTTVTIVVYC